VERARVEQEYEDLVVRMRALEEAVPSHEGSAQRLSAYGLLASAKKQVARLIRDQKTDQSERVGEPVKAALGLNERQILEESRQYYLKCFRLAPGEPWPLVQYLALSLVLGNEVDLAVPGPRRGFEQIWDAAYFLAVDNLDPGHEASYAGPPQQRSLHAHGALTELFVLAQMLPTTHWAHAETEVRAQESLARVVGISRENVYPQASFDAYSVLRQLRRYGDWWWADQPDKAKLPLDLLNRMRRAGVHERWPWQTLVR